MQSLPTQAFNIALLHSRYSVEKVKALQVSCVSDELGDALKYNDAFVDSWLN